MKNMSATIPPASLDQEGDNSAASQQFVVEEEDTKTVVNFLLALKHRSVTPEPDPSHNVNEKPAKKRRNKRPIAVPPIKSRKNEEEEDEKEPPLLEECPNVGILMQDTHLIQSNDRGLVPDALLVAMAQMKPCHLTHVDRIGCYKNRPIGFVGLSCKHCGGQPGHGRFFPGTLRSLAQTTTSQTMIKHVTTKCHFCPSHVRQVMRELQDEKEHEVRPRYGARKIFFERVWNRLHHHGGDSKNDVKHHDSSEEEETEEENDVGKHLPVKKTLKRRMIMGEHASTNKRSRVKLHREKIMC